MSERNHNILPILLAVFLAGVITAAAVLLVVEKRGLDTETEAALGEETVCLSDELLLGTYDVRFDYPDSVERFVGIVERDASENYVLTILSEYAPKVVLLEMQSDGSLSNSDFGTGIVSYKEHLNKVIIRFNKEDYRCTLTK